MEPAPFREVRVGGARCEHGRVQDPVLAKDYPLTSTPEHLMALRDTVPSAALHPNYFMKSFKMSFLL